MMFLFFCFLVFEVMFPLAGFFGGFFPRYPSRHSDGQSPVLFTLKVNETSTGTSDVFSTGLFLSYLILICSGQKTILEEKVGTGEPGRLALPSYLKGNFKGRRSCE